MARERILTARARKKETKEDFAEAKRDLDRANQNLDRAERNRELDAALDQASRHPITSTLPKAPDGDDSCATAVH